MPQALVLAVEARLVFRQPQHGPVAHDPTGGDKFRKRGVERRFGRLAAQPPQQCRPSQAERVGLRAVPLCKRRDVRLLEALQPLAAYGERRGAAAKAARDYLALALGYAREARPALVVVCGVSGSGKSTVAQRLQDRTGFELVRSDVVRKRLAGVAPTSRLGAEYGAGAYSREFTERTYAALLAEASTHLADGAGAIADATFAAPAYRARAREVAERAGVPILFIECRASEDEILRRLAARERRADEVSDAGRAVYLRQRGEFVPLADVPERLRMVADTTRGAGAPMAAIRKRLADLRQADG